MGTGRCLFWGQFWNLFDGKAGATPARAFGLRVVEHEARGQRVGFVVDGGALKVRRTDGVDDQVNVRVDLDQNVVLIRFARQIDFVFKAGTPAPLHVQADHGRLVHVVAQIKNTFLG